MRLGILIRDREYRSAILEMISEFDREIFVEIADENGAGRESVILTDILPEELSGEQLARLVHRTVFLTSSRVEIDDGIHRAFKYGDISEIMFEIFTIYSEWTGDSGINHPLSRTIAVCNATDSLATERCKALARAIIYSHGGSVLILPLGYINDYISSYLNKEDSFRRMMYLIDSEINISVEAFSEVDSYGISYLKMKGRNNQIALLDITYMNKLIQYVCKKFDTVIFDIGTCYRKENISIIDTSDTIICFGNSRLTDFSDLIGSGAETRAKHITEDGITDETITITDIVEEMYLAKGVKSNDKRDND